MHSWSAESVPIARRQTALVSAIALLVGGALAGADLLAVVQHRLPAVRRASRSAPLESQTPVATTGSAAMGLGASKEGFAAARPRRPA